MSLSADIIAKVRAMTDRAVRKKERVLHLGGRDSITTDLAPEKKPLNPVDKCDCDNGWVRRKANWCESYIDVCRKCSRALRHPDWADKWSKVYR